MCLYFDGVKLSVKKSSRYNRTIKLAIRYQGAKNRNQTHKWKEKHAYIGLENLLTIAAIEKVDTCPIEGFNPEQHDKRLELDKLNLRSIVLYPIGHRAEKDNRQYYQKFLSR